MELCEYPITASIWWSFSKPSWKLRSWALQISFVRISRFVKNCTLKKRISLCFQKFFPERHCVKRLKYSCNLYLDRSLKANISLMNCVKDRRVVKQARKHNTVSFVIETIRTIWRNDWMCMAATVQFVK